MTRLTIDLPESLHKTLKTLSVIDGETMREIAINAIEGYTKERVSRKLKKHDSNITNSLNKLLQLLEAGNITQENFNKKLSIIRNALPENEYDKIITPYLEYLIKNIDDSPGYSWEDVQKQLAEDE